MACGYCCRFISHNSQYYVHIWFQPVNYSIIVVQFDGDEDDKGIVPQRHIPARFVSLIPREFPASKNKNRKRKSATVSTLGGGSSAPPPSSAPPAKDGTVDEMLLGHYGYLASNAMHKMDDADMVFSSTPHSTPPPPPNPEGPLKATRRKSQTKRASKKQKNDDQLL